MRRTECNEYKNFDNCKKINIIIAIVFFVVLGAALAVYFALRNSDSYTQKYKNIFFIRGYNTFDVTYKSIEDYYTTYKFTYFIYNPSEDIRDVFNRLKDQIAIASYDIIMCHSMGGYLTSKLMELNLISPDTPIIMLMPLVYPGNITIKVVNALDTDPDNYDTDLLKSLPIGFIAPDSSLTSKTKPWQDMLKLNYWKHMVPDIQLLQTGKYLNYNYFLKKLRLYKNLYFIYVTNEKLTTLPAKQQTQIKNIIGNRFYLIKNGYHEAFNDVPKQSKVFFDAVNNILERINT